MLLMKIYGPYTRKDGRKHIIKVFDDGTRRTVSYPKHLMELRLGRPLAVDETVDHINKDFTDDSPDNLRVLKLKEHATLDVTRLRPMSLECPQCSKSFKLAGLKLQTAIQNSHRGKAGPFCSKRCAGIYATNIQHGKSLRLESTPLVSEYYTLKGDMAKLVETHHT